MNTKLVEYGIQTEKSDLRAHVCVVARRVYVYPTLSGVNAINTEKYRLASAYQGDIKTARGYLVPPDDIEGCQYRTIPDYVWDWLKLTDDLDTSTKGRKAVSVTKWLMKKGGFPAPLEHLEIDAYDLQVEGVDIIVSLNARTQVKCDFRGGHTDRGGTGNLFLQTEECNPYNKH